MLVLALQFSKGDAQRWGPMLLVNRTLGAEDRELECSTDHAVREERIPQNRREDKALPGDRDGGRILRHLERSTETHQCTNWDFVSIGWNECPPTVERISLERR
jgi:hypothetical protein